jgi:all-trans-retinol dehydrogenase (NAD+)
VATKIRSEHGDPSVLINNAGIGSWTSILGESEEMIRRTFNVNTVSHFLVVKEFLPAMIQKNHGHVVTIASLASFAVTSRNVDYSCTKASALAFHEGLTCELKATYGADKIRTTVVHPSWVRTPLIQKLTQHPKWKSPTMEPEIVVDAVVGQILSGRSGHIILPTWLTFVSGIRGIPLWLQYSLRNQTAKLLDIAVDL